MKALKGSKTEQSLKDAFAGESQANRRYLYFAAKADVEGQNDVASIFAIHAALTMQASIVRLNDDLDRKYGVRLSLRIGVNTGEVVAGLLAGDVQRAYTVVGDAVNTAQRLESAAPLGQVLVSETTRRLAMHRFEFEKRDPITLKGKSEPVITYRVIRVLEMTVEPDATPFVGRMAELAQLDAALAEARAGRGQVVAIVGEPGVGKSRLVAEFRSTLPAAMDQIGRAHV